MIAFIKLIKQSTSSISKQSQTAFLIGHHDTKILLVVRDICIELFLLLLLLLILEDLESNLIHIFILC